MIIGPPNTESHKTNSKIQLLKYIRMEHFGILPQLRLPSNHVSAHSYTFCVLTCLGNFNVHCYSNLCWALVHLKLTWTQYMGFFNSIFSKDEMVLSLGIWVFVWRQLLYLVTSYGIKLDVNTYWKYYCQ